MKKIMNLVIALTMALQAVHPVAQAEPLTPSGVEMIFERTARVRSFLRQQAKAAQNNNRYRPQVSGKELYIQDLSAQYDELLKIVVTTKASRFQRAIEYLLENPQEIQANLQKPFAQGLNELHSDFAWETKRRLIAQLESGKSVFIEYIAREVNKATSVTSFLHQQGYSYDISLGASLTEGLGELNNPVLEFIAFSGGTAAIIVAAAFLLSFVEPMSAPLWGAAALGAVVGAFGYLTAYVIRRGPIVADAINYSPFDFSRTTDMEEILYVTDTFLGVEESIEEAKIFLEKKSGIDEISEQLKMAVEIYNGVYSSYVEPTPLETTAAIKKISKLDVQKWHPESTK